MSGVPGVFDAVPLGAQSAAIPLVVAGLLAGMGLFVAYQGYRGYARNDNRTLLLLSAGILFLTTVPVVLESLIRVTDVLPLSQGVLGSQLLNVLGLVLILYAFTRP